MTSIFIQLTFILLMAHMSYALAIPVENNNANAYTGPGGHSPGGSVGSDSYDDYGHGLGGLLNVFSNNAGDGGPAYSGDAEGGHISHGHKGYGGSSSSGNAYTGPGGYSPGGSVNGPAGLINLFSGNAGNGGDAHSGSAKGGGAGGQDYHDDHDHYPECHYC